MYNRNLYAHINPWEFSTIVHMLKIIQVHKNFIFTTLTHMDAGPCLYSLTAQDTKMPLKFI